MRLHMDYEKFRKELDQMRKDELADKKFECDVLQFNAPIRSDRVNSPSHYTNGKVEAIEVIEDAIQGASSINAGMLQAQVLKYLLRLWYKDDPAEDAKKAQWYLNRLVTKLEEEKDRWWLATFKEQEVIPDFKRFMVHEVLF